MISYRLTSVDGARATYSYEVEGKHGDAGVAILDIDANTCEITEPAPTDKAVGYPWYGGKMEHALESFRKAGELRDSGTIAWY